MLRDFLDEILDFIDSESLTDNEYNTLSGVSEEYSTGTYTALKAILEAREAVSSQLTRLSNLFLAKGVSLTTTDATQTPQSKIFIGAEL